MLKSLRLTAAPFVVLLALMSGCSVEQTQATSSSPTPIPSLPTKPAPTLITSSAPSVLPLVNPFQDASDKAISAATISQSVQSKNDWNLVFGIWQEAITLMEAIPKSSSKYALAQKKVTEYKRGLASAKQQAVKPSNPLNLTVAQELNDANTTAGSVTTLEPINGSSGLNSSLSSVGGSSGSCDYSWQTDFAGRSCGDRAASVRSGGTSSYSSSSSSASSSSGSTYVNGYTRKDGTSVRGYSRRK